VGIDIGVRRLHVVALTAGGAVADARPWPAEDTTGVAASLAAGVSIAVDAPDSWSTLPHRGDERLSKKFRTARCGEIALGRQFGLWVPWVAPADPTEAPAWMRVGVELFTALRAAGHDPVEVYPHAAFRVLAGRGGSRLPPKSSPAGRAARVALLQAAGVAGVATLASSHDLLDAAAAALVALHRQRGVATAATCGHDATAIWLPSAAGVAESSEAPLR
jgi:predicted nuclease with RNAse H fold